jgi:hypothetical protein
MREERAIVSVAGCPFDYDRFYIRCNYWKYIFVEVCARSKIRAVEIVSTGKALSELPMIRCPGGPHDTYIN